MSSKRRGLGRGLDALLGASADAHVAAVVADQQLRELPVDLVVRGRFQPRTHIAPEALEELTQSIRARGVVQPIVVRPAEDGRHFEIIAGERRWRAAQAAGLADIPAVVRDVADDAAFAIALIENIQREDLNPMEEAAAVGRLIEEFNLTHQEAADAIGRSRVGVSNMLRLLELGDEARSLVEQGELDMGHARALLGLKGDVQSRAAREVVSKALTARQTEELVRRLKEPADAKPAATRGDDPDVRRLTEKLSEQLGARVQILQGGGSKGRLVIHYTDLDELDGILDRIK
ncbi:MAG: ParB/RepB/Spo0J family partition protein [Gammaproteobacteria bacterium]|nr:ParB/RepB/Spo0J family partition protein [Gammaproteobacteria bacterium]MDX2461488.1 ParB/RepB/Spo0J family partition protein [Gammaproteobacteria bacterium]